MIWAGLLLAQILFFYILSKIPRAVTFFESLFELKKEWHQSVFSKLSFSVGDIAYIVLIFWLILIVVELIFLKNKRKSCWFKILKFLNIFYFIYQTIWGMMYFQTPIVEKLNASEPTLDDYKYFAQQYLKKCKEGRKFVSEDKNGIFIISNSNEVKTEILRQQFSLPKSIISKKATGIDNFKRSIFGKTMSFSGILGYYNPFTSEAQYNKFLPATEIPFTLSHESAHQLGFAREQEANFIGFLIAKTSTNKDLNYSANYFALKSLLAQIYEHDPRFVKNILKQYSEGMKRDRLYEKAFNKKHEGLMDIFFSYTNDIFLKSNQQEGSITYNYFTDLLIRYEKSSH